MPICVNRIAVQDDHSERTRAACAAEPASLGDFRRGRFNDGDRRVHPCFGCRRLVSDHGDGLVADCTSRLLDRPLGRGQTSRHTLRRSDRAIANRVPGPTRRGGIRSAVARSESRRLAARKATLSAAVESAASSADEARTIGAGNGSPSLSGSHRSVDSDALLDAADRLVTWTGRSRSASLHLSTQHKTPCGTASRP